MNMPILIAVGIFLVSVVLSQKIAVNAGAKLDDEMKLKIAKVFPARNVKYTMFIFAVVLAYLIAIYVLPQHLSIITIGYACVFVVYIFAKLFLNVKKLRDMSAPEFYIRSVIISFAVFIGGSAAAGIVFGISNATFAE